MMLAPSLPTLRHRAQRGASLVIVMLILIVVSVLGIGSAQIALMSERGARNDRDLQVAWQAAEAALMDSEFDIHPSPRPATPTVRQSQFDGKKSTPFIDGCGTSGNSVGLCNSGLTGKPAWLTADYTATGSSAATVQFGAFTGRVFAAGTPGVQPAMAPRYIIELVPDLVGDRSNPTFLYRVTAMGFGPRTDIQAVLQTLYRN